MTDIEKNNETYDSSAIKVLKGLEPVKHRPGMYTRTENPNHIVQEVIDNAQDEALAGFANKITVSVRNGEVITVQDNGRGIPVDPMKDDPEGRPAAVVIFSELHSGGKFEKETGKGAYSFSGGLHGVGVSVTNALSDELRAIIKKNGSEYTLKFENGELVEPLQKVKDIRKNDSGTTIIIKPNPIYFEEPKIDLEALQHYMRVKSALLNGVLITFQKDDEEPLQWKYDSLKDYLVSETKKLNNENVYWLTDRDSDIEENPNEESFIWEFEKYLTENNGIGFKGEGLNVAIGFLTSGKVFSESFVNLIKTPDGGTHERGLKNGIFEALSNFMKHYNLLPAKLKLESDDLWQKCSFALSCKVLNPSFQGQTKDKLISEPIARLNLNMIKDSFELWLTENPQFGKRMAEEVIANANRRTRAEKPVERKKSSGSTTLPGKLYDCENLDQEKSELFLVEGDSAAGSAKMGRNKNYQAILPLRGKILNTWEVKQRELFESETIENISTAIGIPPHTLEDEVDFSKLRYSKICSMCDADVDGRHIEVLTNTLFFKHFPQLVERGHVYIAKAPLYKVEYPSSKKRKTKLDAKEYLQDDEAKEKFIKSLMKQGYTSENWKVSRFKGLGEMNPEQLWETTLNPDNRYMIRLNFKRENLVSVNDVFDLMMAKGSAKRRKELMEEGINGIEIDTHM